MTKKNINKQRMLSITGAVVAAASVGALFDFSVRKALRKKAYTAEIVLGLVGIAAGIGIATYQHYSSTKVLKVTEVFDDSDANVAGENISEVLGTPADTARKKKVTVKTIELDEEASIEDFI